VIGAAKKTGRELTMAERETVARFQRLRFHDLRHTFITQMAERNVPLPVVQAMVGHMSAEMTRCYTQISDRAQRNAVELLDKARKPAAGAECGEFCGESPSAPRPEATKLLN